MKFQILLFLSLFLFSLCQYKESIEEGFKSYSFEQNTFNFTFTAIDNGNYIIIFSKPVYITETTGVLNSDAFPDHFFRNYSFLTRVFSQNFTTGDFFKVYSILSEEDRNLDIKIEKIDAYFRLMTSLKTIMFTSAINDCSKPTYILTYKNPFIDSNKFFYFYAEIYSGNFSGSYRTTNLDLNDKLNKDFQKFDITSLKNFSMSLEFNIVKLECTNPGFIGVYMTNSFYAGIDTISILEPSQEYYVIPDREVPPYNVYFQSIHFFGKANFDFKKHAGGGVKSGNFIDKFNVTKENWESLGITINNGKSYSMVLTYYIIGELNHVEAKINEKISLMKDKQGIFYLENYKSKYIKITSSVPNFYWNYLVSLTTDFEYLPKLYSNYSRNTINFVKGKTVYINNPYSYNSTKIKHIWFISFIHFNNKKVVFTCTYTNEINDTENENDDDEVDDEENKSFFSSPIFWIIICGIITIIILFLGFFLYRRRKRNNNVVEGKLLDEY